MEAWRDASLTLEITSKPWGSGPIFPSFSDCYNKTLWLSDSNHRNVLQVIPEPGTNIWQVWVRALLAACSLPSSLLFLLGTLWCHHRRATYVTLSKLNHLPTTPVPNTLTVGTGTSLHEWWDGAAHQHEGMKTTGPSSVQERNLIVCYAVCV